MTHEEFTKEPKLRNDLAAILDNPTLVTAIGIVRDMTEPQIGTGTDTNPVLCASRFQQRAGMNAFLTSLRNLTKEPKGIKRPAIPRLAKSLDDLPPE